MPRFSFQLSERWQEEDSEIAFKDDRVDSDDEDPDFASYTPRVDLEDLQAARASKDSLLAPLRDRSDGDDCCIVEPSVAYALSTGGSAGTAARTGIRLNAPPAAGRKGKKAAKKDGPPTMPARSRAPRVMPTESG